MKSPKTDIGSKKQAILAIGDLAMYGGDIFSNTYLDGTMKMLS